MGRGAGHGAFASLHPSKWQAQWPHEESSKKQLSDGIHVYLLHTPHANKTSRSSPCRVWDFCLWNRQGWFQIPTHTSCVTSGRCFTLRTSDPSSAALACDWWGIIWRSELRQGNTLSGRAITKFSSLAFIAIFWGLWERKGVLIFFSLNPGKKKKISHYITNSLWIFKKMSCTGSSHHWSTNSTTLKNQAL